MSAKVDVFDDEHPGRTDVLMHGGDQAFGVSEMGQEKSGIDDIEGFAWLPFGDISHLEGDVRKALLLRFPSRHFDLGLVKVYLDCPTSGSRCTCKLERHVTAAAPNIEVIRIPR